MCVGGECVYVGEGGGGMIRKFKHSPSYPCLDWTVWGHTLVDLQNAPVKKKKTHSISLGL